ncbi:prephenate dehydratase domain-containing protein [Streptomyces sp. bgisy034]|uniref:prephenate dehydratase domain-containing protein n=1 Tax=Streptomyces sp. bgisy034 TaxID=3413774 RepID=UPI003EB7173E
MILERSNWLALEAATVRPDSPVIGTLGPAGTSSEQAAVHLRAVLDPDSDPTEATADVQLYDSYEEAGEALATGEVGRLVVANAYAGINAFYMNPALDLAGAFVFDTPHYGIARARGHRVPPRPRVATHPAPVALVAELLPRPYTAQELVLTTSTSTAARAARDLDTDLALTTEQAAALHELEFISRTRPIRMLWSVFVNR